MALAIRAGAVGISGGLDPLIGPVTVAQRRAL
jgi:hypothetical protein